MAVFSFTISQAVQNETRSIGSSDVYTGTAKTSVNETIDWEVTNQVVDFAVQVADVVVMYLVSSHDVTLKTNSSGSPDTTLALIAGVPYVWTIDSYDDLIFGTNISKLYVTNNSGSTGDAVLQVECLYNS